MTKAELVDMGLMTEAEAEGRDTFLDDVQEALRRAELLQEEPPAWAVIAQHGLDLIQEARRVRRIDELRRDWEAAYKVATYR